MPETLLTSPLQRLDPAATSEAARKESRRREIHLPPISTFRWWARRTKAVNGAILDAFAEGRASRLTVADPFAGGGTIALAAAARGHQVYAQDINPWATLGLTTMLALPEPSELEKARDEIWEELKATVREAYNTEFEDGSSAYISHTFRVGSVVCPDCGTRHRIFPYAMVSLKKRKDAGGESAFLACPRGHLVEAQYNSSPSCHSCDEVIDPEAHYTSGRRSVCPDCKAEQRLESLFQSDTWRWKIVLVERARGRERHLAKPSKAELNQASRHRWVPTKTLPRIRSGVETDLLRSFGFNFWHDLYPRRQRVVLECLIETIDRLYGNTDCGEALRLAALGTAEMAGFISRWDRWYLKSYEGMANHRFNVTPFSVEPNVWGAEAAGRGTFIRRIDQLVRASQWLKETRSQPFLVEGPLAADEAISPIDSSTDVRIVEGSSERIPLPDKSVDLVLTDPPYHDDIQYDELSLLFRAWAGLETVKLTNEAVVHRTQAANEDSSKFREILTSTFREVTRVLSADGHLIFTYANRDPDAWVDLIYSLDAVGLNVIGYEILHSDNETDQSKRGVRACNRDLVVDAVTKLPDKLQQWEPAGGDGSAEEEYLRIVGSLLLKVGSLPKNWENDLRKKLADTIFLS